MYYVRRQNESFTTDSKTEAEKMYQKWCRNSTCPVLLTRVLKQSYTEPQRIEQVYEQTP